MLKRGAGKRSSSIPARGPKCPTEINLTSTDPPTPSSPSHSVSHQRAWEDSTRRPGGPSRPLSGVLPVQRKPRFPCFYLFPGLMPGLPANCGAGREHQGANADLFMKHRHGEHKARPDTCSQSLLAALGPGGLGLTPWGALRPTLTPTTLRKEQAILCFKHFFKLYFSQVLL